MIFNSYWQPISACFPITVPAGWASCLCSSVNSRWKRASWYNFTWFFSYEYLPLCCGITSVGWAKSLFRFFCKNIQKPFWPPYCLFITFTHFSLSSCAFWFLGTFYILDYYDYFYMIKIIMIYFLGLFVFWLCLWQYCWVFNCFHVVRFSFAQFSAAVCILFTAPGMW